VDSAASSWKLDLLTASLVVAHFYNFDTPPAFEITVAGLPIWKYNSDVSALSAQHLRLMGSLLKEALVLRIDVNYFF